MAYRYGDRLQPILFPRSIAQYIPRDAPVRAYDAIIDSLDFAKLGIDLDPHKVGCPEYNPKVMLKLLVYGYSYGIRSSRKLERETHYNLSFIWLTGGLKPDHKTIAEFRRKNKSALKKVLSQCARICIELGLIEGNTLFVDGSRVRANASIDNTWTKERCHEYLKKIDKRIKQILSECDLADESEKGQSSLVELGEELKDRVNLESKIKAILKQINEQGKHSVNTTDEDCVKVRSRQGSHAGYNAQAVVDEKHGLIVSSDVVDENNDVHQFAKQIYKANETLQDKCHSACADAGYAGYEELEKIDKQGIKVIVPSRKQAAREKRSGPLDKSHFKYDRENDCYICPAGEVLTYRRMEPERRRRVYRLKRSVCQKCRYFGVCTTGKIGRKLTRLNQEDLKDKLETVYEQPESQAVFKLRKEKVELPFGHIKRNLKFDAFLLRGLDGVKAEFSLLSSCFNVARLITILGVPMLLAKLTG